MGQGGSRVVCRHRRVNSVVQVTGRVGGLEEMASRPVGVLAECGDAAIWKETWAGAGLRAKRLLGRVRQSQGPFGKKVPTAPTTTIAGSP